VTDRRVVVIGVGNEFRHDDGVGPAVIAVLGESEPTGAELVVSDGEPTRLLEAWTGADLAIVVDAVTGGSAAGTLHRIVISPDEPGSAVLPGSGTASSHALGVGDAVSLARPLGRLPGTLIVYAVQAADLSQGHGLSPEVAGVLDELAAAVIADVRSAAA
jgi:hydrogenase maturation protease